MADTSDGILASARVCPKMTLALSAAWLFGGTGLSLETSVKQLKKLKYHDDDSDLQRQVPPDLPKRFREKQVWLPLVESRPVEQENDKPYTDRPPSL
jgi:hypothetical protein